jgi:CRISPR type III-A-associated RAMP protein Csm4
MSFDIIKLTFEGPLHLSKGLSDYGTGHDILHSDTLKAALFAAGLQSGLDIESEENGRSFLDAFVLSSAFPYYQDQYFLPKPNCKMPAVKDANGGVQDKLSDKIRFIGKDVFEMLANRHLVNQDEHGEWKFDYTLSYDNDLWHDGKFAAKGISEKAAKDPDFYIMVSDNIMRVAVPRYGTEDPRPYYVERTYFSSEGGLYFFVQWLGDSREDEFNKALDTLSENGIGTDRNTGNGQFTWKKETIEINVPQNHSHRVLLSLYVPAKEALGQINLSDSRYSLSKRGGYISSPADEKNMLSYRKNAVYMLNEGSLLATNGPMPEGELLNLKPSGKDLLPLAHPIWRDGRAFSLPINPILP